MIRWQDPAGLERLIRRRIEPYEDRQFARVPMRMWPRIRAEINAMVVEGRLRGEAIHNCIIPALICSLLPGCESRLHSLTGHEMLDAAAKWTKRGALSPERSAIQLVETVSLILDRPQPAINYLFRDGRMKEALMRGSTRCLTLDDGQQM